MSKNNGVLSQLCANLKPNQTLSQPVRALIVHEVESGKSYRDVAAEAKCSPSTVGNIFRRWTTFGTLEQKPITGHPRKLTKRDIRYAQVSLKRDLEVTYGSLLNSLGNKVSRKTLQRTIRAHHGQK